MQEAYDHGVNFFDNAEIYADGESERIMGKVFDKLGWERHSYVVSSKFFWGIKDGVNSKNTLNRKYLMEAIDPSLERIGLDHYDLIFCHRPDPETPIEETVWAMSDIISLGVRCTGAPRSGRPTRSAPRGRSPSDTTSTSRSWSSRSTTCCTGQGREGVRTAVRATSGWGLTTWSRWPAAC
jgi:aryl-alcohol dehydrogenase-like predicted oxidoreductase